MKQRKQSDDRPKPRTGSRTSHPRTAQGTRGRVTRTPAGPRAGVAAARVVARARLVAQAQLPTSFGEFRVVGIEGRPGEEAVAIQRGTLRSRNARNGKAPLVRVHSQCLTGDVFTSERCDCRAQLEFSLKQIAKELSGVLLYLPQEGRGIGLINKLRAYELQDAGLDTVQANSKLGFAADSRDYEFAAEALKALGVHKLRLLSNNPDKVEQLESAGLRVVERVPCRPRTSRHSEFYLRTKKDKLGHLLA